MLHFNLASGYVIAIRNRGDAVVLPVGACGNDIDHNNAGIRCTLGRIDQAVRIDRLKQDCVKALGDALFNLADLGCGILICAEDGQIHAHFLCFGFCGLRDGDLERVCLMLRDQRDLVCAALAAVTAVACSRVAARVGAAGGHADRHCACHQHSQQSLLHTHFSSSSRNIYDKRGAGVPPVLNILLSFSCACPLHRSEPPGR